jgi:hypothetical protein
MTKLIAAALALGVAGWAASASADCPGHMKSVKKEQTVVQESTTPTTTLPITPAPETKTGG